MLDGIQDSDAPRTVSATRPDPRPHVFVGESSAHRRALLVETLSVKSRFSSAVAELAGDGDRGGPIAGRENKLTQWRQMSL